MTADESLFYGVVDRLLTQRLELANSGVQPRFTDIRHFFYEARNLFLRENPELTEIDNGGKSNREKYDNYSNYLTNWCRKVSRATYSSDRALEVRDYLNIYAQGRAICQVGRDDRMLIDHTTRDDVTDECSFVLFCEKDAVSRELWDALSEDGYHIRVVSTGGHASLDAQEVLIQLREEMANKDTPNFYVLYLHDYDIAGAEMYFKGKECYGQVLDVGVNGRFLKFLKNYGEKDPKFYEEPGPMKGDRRKLAENISHDEDYDESDLDYLQSGKRIEIDPLSIEYGIQPFVDYIQKQIEEKCRVWDLSRIGVRPFALEEPNNHYESAIREFEDDVRNEWNAKKSEVATPIADIKEVVMTELRKYSKPFEGLKEEYWTGSYFDTQEFDKTKQSYSNQISKKWSEEQEYVDNLEEVNNQIEYYEGDVREGEDDLRSRRGEIQARLEQDKANDEDLEAFRGEMSNIDYGKDKLEEIEVPDEAQMIRDVIARLQELLDELTL